MGQPTYSIRNIRKLLIAAFSEQELRQICYDEPQFRPVYEEKLSQNMGKESLVQEIIEYSERRNLLGNLLEIVEEEAPAKYQEFADKLVSGGNVTTSAVPKAVGRKEEIEQLQTLITTNTRRLYKLQQQAAAYGLSTPPEIQIQIEDLEAQIAELKQKLNA